ncbi:prepilin-type N-terminal cleavage/methylation domain-containing protein [Providencia manganoxydans]|uniref:Prepilin-type N-terminal cleavage/methylation domain-containing protein n=1 Tax=Providencia manganoxydans TaxID=2923283 RepID=A0ABX7ACS2_9GAMM|nr:MULTISPECIES: prepilin-type N-terminal cleavage/methylation domain-containing protein [Providencia]MDX4946130.1 prepilin-type N-terminal cleavage/methylation domain-containing protein [Providencia manganoxydans]QQO61721.1 prepilin-type N-terminal cleavage/methylation domain-containing protein [Providencia manganoxydans]HEF8771125.1 prepilin-type N-terminal cleavage/methylation domain-containing protein [Providencia stuartii]
MGRQTQEQEKGFTLIEILVVIFICSLVLLPALYGWQQQQQRTRLIDAARQVAVFIYSHLMESIYLNQHRILLINNAQGNWSITIKDAVTNQQIAMLSSAQFNNIEMKSATRTSVNLYGKQGTSHAFRIELINDFGQMTVFMSAAGRIRGCSNKKIIGVPRC